MFLVAALYRFVPLPDFEDRREALLTEMERNDVCGTLLLASEGINGTIAGSQTGVGNLIGWLRDDPKFTDLEVKFSECEEKPFRRGRVRLKKEIVTMGVDEIDPLQSVGTYVDPLDWNRLIEDPEVTLIDTRNDYEVAIGKFEGATNPETETFRDFPQFVDEQLDPEKHPKVAMYCTGGIRCEKSTAFLKQRGFAEVYHLRGGILKYLETVDAAESKWRGDCFVFDSRVAVGHGLVESNHVMCYGCGWPVSENDQVSTEFENGVHCPNCVDRLSQEQIKRFRERQRLLNQKKEEPEKFRD